MTNETKTQPTDNYTEMLEQSGDIKMQLYQMRRIATNGEKAIIDSAERAISALQLFIQDKAEGEQ